MCTSEVCDRHIPAEGQEHGWRDTDQLRGISYNGFVQQAIALDVFFTVPVSATVPFFCFFIWFVEHGLVAWLN